MDNCTYNKAKILKEFGCLNQFIRDYAKNDAKNECLECLELIKEIENKLSSLEEELKEAFKNH